MANKVPLILNTTNSTIEELPSGDNLDLSGSNISSVGNITAGNSVSANYFVGTLYGQANSAITANTADTANSATTANTANSISGSNVTGQVANALISGTVYTSSQPNITSVGTLSNLTSNGTINFTNASNVSLGNISNVKITGGSSNQLIRTDGSGNLSFATISGDSFQLRPVRVATTGVTTLSGTQTIDGIPLNVGDRVLVWLQSNSAFNPDVNNGIWIVQSGAWTRASDFDNGSATLISGITVVVSSGTSLGGETFVCRNSGTIIAGTTGIIFSRSASMNGLISIWNDITPYTAKPIGGTNSGAIAIGVLANAAVDSVAIGFDARANIGGGAFATAYGYSSRAAGSGVGIGYGATANSFGVTVGRDAGQTTVGESAVLIGYQAGAVFANANIVGVGRGAARFYARANVVAVGYNAGFENLGANSIAIGVNAAYSNGHTNTITLNATGANLNTTQANAFFVKPVRNAITANVMYYDQASGEITYDALANYTANIGAGNLSATGNITASNFIGTLANGTSNVRIPTANSDITFATSGSERMRIESTGNVLIGTSTAPGSITAGIQLGAVTNGTVSAQGNANTAYNHWSFINNNGTVGTIQTSGSSTTYATSSDQRLKENITDAPSASSLIDAIQVRSFDWKIDGKHQPYGMIAQELMEVVPDAVTQSEDPNQMMGVDYSKLVPILVKEIQELRSRLSNLENVVNNN